ncbi:MAG: hypothetical protein Q9160_006884 [Pyrenula sp. 1 TL-2023]
MAHDSTHIASPLQVQAVPVTIDGQLSAVQDAQLGGGFSSTSPSNPALNHVLPTPGSSPNNALFGDLSRQRTQSDSTLSVPSGSSAADNTVYELQRRIQSLEKDLAEARKASSARLTDQGLAPPGKDRPIRGMLSKTRLFGPSHWMSSVGSAEQFHTVAEIVGSDEPNNTNSTKDPVAAGSSQTAYNIWHILKKCKNLARKIKTQGHTPWLTEAQWKESVPPREIADKLVGNYIRTFESAYRILHIPSFDTEYQQYWQDPKAAGQGFVIKMLLVMAIGTSFYQGHLVRLAMTMGLHRDPCHFPKMSIMQTELRRRLWSTVIEMALQTSLEAGMIPMIRLDDFDTRSPSNIDDHEMNENTTSLSTTKPLSIFTQTSFQIILRRSFATRLNALAIINHIHDDPSYDTILAQHRLLETAFRETATLVQGYRASRLPPLPFGSAANATTPSTVHTVETINTSTSTPPPISSALPQTFTPFHTTLLTHLQNRILLSLHRSSANLARSDPKLHFSRATCLSTALSLLQSSASIPSSSGSEDWTSLILIGGGGFHETTQCQPATLIYIELINLLDDDVANLTMDNETNKAERKRLLDALKGCRDVYREQVKRGKTNVKGFCFMSIAIAHVEAVEQGKRPEVGILESAEKTGMEAYELLRNRLGEEGLTEQEDGEIIQQQQQQQRDDPERPICKFTNNLMRRIDQTAKELESGNNAGGEDANAQAKTGEVAVDGNARSTDWDAIAAAGTAADNTDVGFDLTASWLFSGWDEYSWV